MSDTSTEYGPKLAAWISGYRAKGESARSFGTRVGIDDARLSAWKRGSTPTLDAMRSVADALEVSLADVLIAAGLARPEEFVVHEAPKPRPFLEVLDLADDVDEHDRRLLAVIWENIGGRQSSLEVRGRTVVGPPRRTPAKATRPTRTTKR